MEKKLAIVFVILGLLLFSFGCLNDSGLIQIVGAFFIFLAIAFFDHVRIEKRK